MYDSWFVVPSISLGTPVKFLIKATNKLEALLTVLRASKHNGLPCQITIDYANVGPVIRWADYCYRQKLDIDVELLSALGDNMEEIFQMGTILLYER